MNESEFWDDQDQWFDCHNRPQRSSTTSSTVTSPENSVKNDKKKKVYIYIFYFDVIYTWEQFLFIFIFLISNCLWDQVHYAEDFHHQETRQRGLR